MVLGLLRRFIRKLTTDHERSDATDTPSSTTDTASSTPTGETALDIDSDAVADERAELDALDQQDTDDAVSGWHNTDADRLDEPTSFEERRAKQAGIDSDDSDS